MTRERKEVALAFIQAFYTREELGIDTSEYKADDISDELVLLVDEIMDKMVKNKRLMSAASFLSRFINFNSITQVVSSHFVENDGDLDMLLEDTRKSFADDKKQMMANFFTRGALLALLGGRKSEVAMKLYGF